MNQAEEIRRLQEENKLLREALEGLLPIGGVCHPEHCEDLRVEWAEEFDLARIALGYSKEEWDYQFDRGKLALGYLGESK